VRQLLSGSLFEQFVCLKLNVVLKHSSEVQMSEPLQGARALELDQPIFFEYLDPRRIDVSDQHMTHMASYNGLDIGNTLVPHQQNSRYREQCLVAKLILSTSCGGLNQLGPAFHAEYVLWTVAAIHLLAL